LGRVNRFVIFTPFVWRPGRLNHVAAGVGAGINQTGDMQGFKRGPIKGQMFALGNHRVLPRKPQPAEVFEVGADEVQPEAIGVEVVVAQEKLSSGLASPFRGDPKGAGMTKMQITRGGGGQTTDVSWRIFNHGWTRMNTDYGSGVATKTSILIYSCQFVHISGLSIYAQASLRLLFLQRPA
jgi:hypothetical protein